MPQVSIVIPNYNGLRFLDECLSSLRKQTFTDMEVVVIDNGSSDGSCEFVTTNYPEVICISLSENTGFCGAVNTGIKESRSPFVLLLNNDTVSDKDFVKNLYEEISSRSNCFSVCGKMIQYHNHALLDDTGDYYCALGWAFARGKDKPSKQYAKRSSVFASCAGAAIYRREVFDEIGYFDENHFAYLEDIDIAYRARIYGYENRYTPYAVVYHVGSGSSGSIYNDFKIKHSSRNSIYLIYKNMPFLQIIINLPFLIVGFFVKFLFFAKKGFGKLYLHGILTGFQLCKKGKKEGFKVSFKSSHFTSYVRIQLELWINIFRRLFN